MEAKNQDQNPERGIPRPPKTGPGFFDIADTLSRFRYSRPFLDLRHNDSLHRELLEVSSDTQKILGADYRADLERWRNIPDSGKSDFLEWRLRNNNDFRLRYERFKHDLGDFPVSEGVDEQVEKEGREHGKRLQEVLEARRARAPIERLSEEEIRREIIDTVQDVLGPLLISPLADASFNPGFGRTTRETSLDASYGRFIKVMDEMEELKGVQVELFGLFFDGREAFRKFDQGFESSDNRYYLIPTDPSLPAVLSTESFVSRAKKVNPEGFERGKAIISAFLPQFSEFLNDSDSKSQRKATVQDLRDALAIVRNMDVSIKRVIGVTPPENWGRPGITE